jgi:hypothetical protein
VAFSVFRRQHVPRHPSRALSRLSVLTQSVQILTDPPHQALLLRLFADLYFQVTYVTQSQSLKFLHNQSRFTARSIMPFDKSRILTSKPEGSVVLIDVLFNLYF